MVREAVRYSSEHKERTRRSILAAAGRGFRKEGFGGIGIDSLARAAKVTSGAFYGHFRSKAEAFRVALAGGLGDLRRGIEDFQTRFGDAWFERFAEFYFTDRVTCELAEGCALPTFGADVARSDAKTKAVFEKEFAGIVAAMAKGLRGETAEAREARAIVLAAIFAGGVTLARSVRDKAQRDRIAAILREAVVRLAEAE
jgi:AcrR family transcriptional regulator